MSKLAKYLITDLKRDWSKPSIKFFRSNGAYGYIMWLTIIDYYFEKKNLSIEKLVNYLEVYASRRTVIDFINKCVEAKFIKKINSTEDKRKTLIQPTEVTIKEYSEWSNEFVRRGALGWGRAEGADRTQNNRVDQRGFRSCGQNQRSDTHRSVPGVDGDGRFGTHSAADECVYRRFSGTVGGGDVGVSGDSATFSDHAHTGDKTVGTRRDCPNRFFRLTR